MHHPELGGYRIVVANFLFATYVVYTPPPPEPNVNVVPGLRSRTIIPWNEDYSQPLSQDAFCVLRSSTNPLFDAFFIGLSGAGNPLLWTVQITIGSSHDGVADGFRIIENLSQKIKEENRPVPAGGSA